VSAKIIVDLLKALASFSPMTNTSTQTEITNAAAEKQIELTEEQFALAVRTLESDIAAHEQRVASWVAAGLDYDPSAAVCNVSAKARAAIRDARNR